MAIVLVNKDGSSNAKVGDYVVTGGGVYQKTEKGSIRVMGLDTATGSSKNFDDVVKKFNSLISGGGGNTQPKVKENTEQDYKVDKVDENGILSLSTAGYDPSDYSTAYSTTSSTSDSFNNIMGFVILGLVGVALLDRFMNGKGA